MANTAPLDSSARVRGGEVEGVAILDAERLLGSRLLPFSRPDPSRRSRTTCWALGSKLSAYESI